MSILRGLFNAALAMLIAALVVTALLLHSSSEQPTGTMQILETRCPAPDGWGAHLVQVGENLDILADLAGLEPAELVIANCLEWDVHPGDSIYIPPPASYGDDCGPPPGWQLYEIQVGDSLSRIANRFLVSEAELWHANCISESMTFSPGFRIYVPSFSTKP
ncbi:MAG: LysM peptidoglycan-binding domain-containing protein [Anaerolineales bacterium]|nr:MAG: LysM peptidoglycan-binding domain-containing protein [Anaerolineales bacterium]